MNIHHATKKKATDLGFSISVDNDNIVTVREDNVVWGIGADPKVILEEAIVNKANNTPEDVINRSMIVHNKYRQLYQQYGASCGDAMSTAMKEATSSQEPTAKGYKTVLNVTSLELIATSNGLDFDKYTHLNNGQLRMTIGNCLRGLLNKGEDVVVGSQTFNAEDWEPASNK